MQLAGCTHSCCGQGLSLTQEGDEAEAEAGREAAGEGMTNKVSDCSSE
jgi:hypothetical protein